MTVSLSGDVTTTISCVPKMAESECEEEKNGNKNLRLMSENGECLSAKSDKKIQDNSLDNLKSLYYVSNVEDNSYSKYSGNSDGVNRASEFCPDVDGFSSQYKGICPNNEENCRKKRCSDRYDSSESSDSGIAVSSSASSGTSDITDPGSPFSTSSDDSTVSPGQCKVGNRSKSEEKSPSWSQSNGRCRSEEKHWKGARKRKKAPNKTDHNFITPETDFKMAPNAPSGSTTCEIWNSITENNTANDTASFNHFSNKTQSEAISKKRLKVGAKESIAPLNINNNIVVNDPSPISNEIETNAEKSKKRRNSDNWGGGRMRTRRSSYDSAKTSSSDTTADVASSKRNKNGPKTNEKPAGCAAKSKTNDRTRHQGKITEYFKSQIKSHGGNKRDVAPKKEGTVASKGKQNKKSENNEPPPKRQKLTVEEKARFDEAVFVKPPTIPVVPVETPPPSSDPNLLLPLPKIPAAVDFLLKKPPETKTLFNKILENHKNRKLAAENYVRIRQSLRWRGSSVGESSQSSSSWSSSTIPNYKPYETSTSYDLTEMENGEMEGMSSNFEVQNNDLDSYLLDMVVSDEPEVTSSEVISSCANAAAESDSSKFPILTVPKTIRFPVVQQNNRVDNKQNAAKETVTCRWDECNVKTDSAGGLLEHLQNAHVSTQVSGEKYVCLWVGCKVYDQKSCSRSWLERHVLSHAGNKPFRCIVDGCGQGFSTQAILERHVNNHFSGDNKKSIDNSIVHKLFRRNGKKLRYRRQPWSARMFDFFDSGVMQGLEKRLLKSTKARTGDIVEDIPGNCLSLTSQVLARRMTADGQMQFLLRWFPTEILEDEWVSEKEAHTKKTVAIPTLPPSARTVLYESPELGIRTPSHYTSSRRKNKGNRTSQPVAIPVEYLMAEKKQKGKGKEKSSSPAQVEVVNDLNSETTEIISQSQLSPSPLPTPSPSPPLLPPPPPAPRKKVSNRRKAKMKGKNKKNDSDVNCDEEEKTLPVAVSVPNVDVMEDTILTTEKTVSLRPKEDVPTVNTMPEEMSVVPVYPTAEEPLPIQTGGIVVDNSKFMSSVKTEMVVSSPYKVVTSQYIEQPFVQAVVPVQVPVTYHVPVVKLAQSCGMIFPQMPNYFIPSPTAVFPANTIPTLRNGFQFSTTGTIQIQTSSTTLQHTASSFMHSTNSTGFQIVQQTPATNFQQSVFASYQNSQIASMDLRSPTLRLLNYQPLIINHAKPIGHVSMTLANVAPIANPNPNALAVTMPTMPLDPSGAAGGVMASGEFLNPTVAPMTLATPAQPPQLPSPPPPVPAPTPQETGSPPTSATTPPKKMVKGNLKILPKPSVLQNDGMVAGTMNQNQCLQS